MRIRSYICLLSVLFVLTAHAEVVPVSPMMQGLTPEEVNSSPLLQASPESTSLKVDDPWEKTNRVIFDFDDWLDKHALQPAATFYLAVVPRPMTKGIHNIYSNVSNIQNVGNDLLQANFYQATSDGWRFIINTTAGIGGTFDVASNIGLYQNDEDFGLTLARWGYTDSRYIVLPFFGPSTIRDTLAMPVDYYAFSPYPYIKNWKKQYMLYLIGILDKRAQLLQYDDIYQQIALDRYAFIRNAYLQQRNAKIQRNQELSYPYFTIFQPKKKVSESD